MKLSFLKKHLLIYFLLIALYSNEVDACTRVVYEGLNGTIVTARSMDWSSDIPANMWMLPRGIERNGQVGANSIKWKSKYGSVVTTAWDIASADGMNEKGLVGNLLWLVESEYPKFEKDKGRKGLTISMWLQYVLDNFSTVKEAVEALRKDEFDIVSTHIPGTDIFATIHLSISDKLGDDAIFEYVNGKLTIHHDKSYNSMTNSPIFEEQKAVNAYWKGIPGTIMLPGTNRGADRFVRASYYIEAIPKTDNTRVAIAGAFSVIRNCSVPLGISTPSEPNIASTRWRTVADHKNLVYYFENVLSPNVIWVEFDKIDFSETAKVKKLSLADNENYAGESSLNFKNTPMFNFAGLH